MGEGGEPIDGANGPLAGWVDAGVEEFSEGGCEVAVEVSGDVGEVRDGVVDAVDSCSLELVVVAAGVDQDGNGASDGVQVDDGCAFHVRLKASVMRAWGHGPDDVPDRGVGTPLSG